MTFLNDEKSILQFSVKVNYIIININWLGMDQCCGASLQFCGHRFWLDDMFCELQSIPQHGPRRHCRRFAHKRLQ